MSALWVLAAAVLAALVQAAAFKLTGLRRVTYDRRFSVRHAFAGERVTLIEVLENRSALPVPWLRAQSRLPDALVFGSGASHDISGGMYHRSLFFIGARQKITRRHPVLLARRGFYRAGSVALSSGDLLGMETAERSLDTGACIAVYPRLLADDALPMPSARLLGELLVRRFLQPDPFLISGVRPWRAGDARRDAHWAATARSGELMAKVRDFTADPRLLVVLNVAKSETQWDDLAGYERDGIEYGVSLAATLCLHALNAGAEAGFAANTDLETTHEAALLLPDRAAGQADALLTLLSRLTLKRTGAFHDRLAAIPVRAGMDALILTYYVDEKTRARLARWREDGVNVTVWRLSDAGVEETGAGA